MMTDTCTATSLTVRIDGDTENVLLLASAAGAANDDVRVYECTDDGAMLVTACTEDGLYALKTLLEIGHATVPNDLAFAPTIPSPPAT